MFFCNLTESDLRSDLLWFEIDQAEVLFPDSQSS